MVRFALHTLRLSAAVALVVGFLATLTTAESKRPLSHADYDAWRSISAPVLSRDGRWLAYAYMPLEGDGEVIVRELATGHEHHVAAGALPPPPVTTMEENPERPQPRRDVEIAFTSDSRFVVATAFPSQAERQAAQREPQSKKKPPHDGLAIVAVSTGEVTHVPSVKSRQLPAHGGAWLAYLKVPTLEEPAAIEKLDDTSPKKTYGSDLVLRDLSASGPNSERVFPNVIDYSLAIDGQALVFTVSSRNESENGIYVVAPSKPVAPVALAQGVGRYRRFIWDREQTQAVFVSDRANPNATAPEFALYHWKRDAAAAREILTANPGGAPAGFRLSEEAPLSFSLDGKKVFIPTAPPAKPSDPRLATLADEEKVAVDLWHWRDDFIPPMQQQRASRDRKQTYLGVLDLASGNYQQVGDPTLPAIAFADDGLHAFGFDDRPYRRQIDYRGIHQDLYLINLATAARTLVAPDLPENAGVRWSPSGRWIAFFNDRHWFAVDVRDGSKRNLTSALNVAFFDELSDLAEPPPPYGTAGWTQDGESLLVYDRYDVWQVFPDGRAARNLTVGDGRAARIQFRVQPIEWREPDSAVRGIEANQPLYLRGENEETRATGFFRTSFAQSAAPEQLWWADKNIRYMTRAAESDVFLVTASRFDEYPDLQVTDSLFRAPKKVSNGGAQLDPFLWGSAELITYRNADGIPLQAMVCKPANFDPTKKYPMIVYIYERLSQIVHTFTAPLPSTVINPPFYTSNGYIVLMPDIRYTVGHPGESAVKCVLPAVDEVVHRGYVNEASIGLEGHSWGGYQTAYILTQTQRFRAAEAGATVSNMTSAYSGIRWGSGRVRQQLYEQNQSRIGRALPDAPLLFLENSPVFFADRVTTPLLLLHNDHDDTVPWYQGIELFLALRRQGKEAYLLNYNNEFHGLRRRADQKDFAKRMSQFFDHFLKGTPAPEWMEKGVPFLDREAEALRFRENP